MQPILPVLTGFFRAMLSTWPRRFAVLASILVLVGVGGWYGMRRAKPVVQPTKASEEQVTLIVDAAVVGAGPSGIAAALELARGGKKVVLIEETDWLGGQMTAAAVPTLDEGYLLKEDAGIYGEFIQALKKAYGDKPLNTCYWGKQSRCFEPAVGRRVLGTMITAQPNIKVMYRTSLVKVWKNKTNGVAGLRTQSTIPENDKVNIRTSIVIDASETGYVLPLAGASFRMGKDVFPQSSTTASTTVATASTTNSCIQSITYPVVVRKYFAGVTPTLKMEVGKPPGGAESYAKAAAFFARFVAKNGNSWFVNGKSQVPYSWSFFTGYRGIPDSNKQATNYSASISDVNSSTLETQYTRQVSKTIVNMMNDVPVDTRFLSDKVYQKKLTCQAKMFSLQFVYYMQVELGMTDWSVANDEGYDKSYTAEAACPELADFRVFERHLPVMPYIRESRRLVGDYTLKGSDIAPLPRTQVAKAFASSLAVGDYSTDLHACDKAPDLEVGLDTKEDITVARRKFQIPFESFVTKEIGGLIVAEKNLSVSRVAASALREQPIAMQTGLAAGAIALVALEQQKLPAAVDFHLVQQKILTAKGRVTTE